MAEAEYSSAQLSGQCRIQNDGHLNGQENTPSAHHQKFWRLAGCDRAKRCPASAQEWARHYRSSITGHRWSYSTNRFAYRRRVEYCEIARPPCCSTDRNGWFPVFPREREE